MLPAVLLALALTGCASPEADLQDQVAQVTAAANSGDVTGLLSEARTLEQLVDRLEGSDDLTEAEATRLRNAAVALQQRAGQLRTASPAPVPSPTQETEEPSPTPETEEPSPEPSPTPSPEPSEEPETEEPSPEPSEEPVPVPPVVPTEEPEQEDQATSSPAALASPETSPAAGTSSSSRRSPSPSPSASPAAA